MLLVVIASVSKTGENRFYLKAKGNGLSATGGAGRIFNRQPMLISNTGDGVAMAYVLAPQCRIWKCGSFHPTGYYGAGLRW